MFMCDSVASVRPKNLAHGFLTLFANSAHFQPHNSYVKTALFGHLFCQFLERRTGVFHDATTAETSHVAVVAIGLGLVIVLLALDMHEIEFIDQSAILEQAESTIDGGTIDVGI